MNNILIIGCGHMGTALLNTWLNKTKNSFTIVDPIRYKILNRKYKKKINCFNNISQINYFIKFDIVILAVNHKEYEFLYDGEWISSQQIIFDVKSVIKSDMVLSL